MSWFNGLYSYEIVLLVLGAILFLVSLVLLIYQVTHAKSLGSLALFFGISVAMIGYPSIQQIQFSHNVLTISKYTDALEGDPTNAKTRDELQRDVSKLASRAATAQVNPQGLTVFATAQYALDDEPAATATLEKALQSNPAEPEALALKSKIGAVQNLSELTARVKADPSNQVAAVALQKSLLSATGTPVASPKALLNIAEAQAVLGQKKQAEVNMQKALTIKPELKVMH